MISIHAPAWGATSYSSTSWPSSEVFQSTLPRGERHAEYETIRRDVEDFNPRSRVGSDGVHVGRTRARDNFNPRSRVGSDSAHASISSCVKNFNPRSRVGSDSKRR